MAIRMLNRLLLAIEFMTDNVGQEHILPALSVIGTIAFIFIIGYLMSYLLRLEEEDIQQKQGKNMENMNGMNRPQLLLFRHR